MRLHRLALTNYRGIAHREIEFADNGVTVVSGANEVGKSSMIEALDLLLESKDRSTKKDVKQVKPTHADVGAEVTAEISTGPYRFVYRKRFHKKCETELTILAPARRQLTGDEAHDRVRAMLDETVDTGLWQAQRVLQAASTSAVDLSGCDALSRALDIAATDSGSGVLSGTEPVLVDKIDVEYARYFTATGRPTGEWGATINRLKEADDEVAQCAAAVAEVQERVQAHAALTDELTSLAGQREDLMVRRTAAAAAADAVAALANELRAANAEADALTAASVAAGTAYQHRARLSADVAAREAAAIAADLAAEQAAASEEAGRAVAAAAEEAAAAAVEALGVANQRVDAARRVVDELAERDEASRLGSRLDRIDAAERELAVVTDQLSAIVLTDNIFRTIEAAAAAIDVAQAQADLTAVRVEFTAESDVELMSGDQTISLTVGQVWSLAAAADTAVRVPGVLGIRVTPGATAANTHAKLIAAQTNLENLLVSGEVASLTEARLVDRRRRDLIAAGDRLCATLAGIRGDDDVDRLRARLAALPTVAPAAGTDLEAARGELAAAAADLAIIAERCDTRRRVAAAATAQLIERSTRTTVSVDRTVAAHAEVGAALQRLAEERTSASDEELSTRAQRAAEAVSTAQGRIGALTARLAEAAPDAVAAELAAAVSAAEALDRNRKDVTGKLRDIAVELAVFGTEGRTGKLDAAQIKREHAAATHSRTEVRARSVQLLRSVMTRHRDSTRLRYVEPFRAEVQRLGRTVFGPTFEVEVDSTLQICNRTIDGRTVPFESLSGGAKEQLGIIARLAVAALVAAEDTVPVVIDDALGFTDSDRLTKMGAVFDLVGAGGQVIVLTCSPERYRNVTGTRVELSA